ncbi:MAG: hypothetical protein K6B74_11280 [Ruminococcus sp.]|nr:hypothetical protein [Ruminococcus sp.]
MAKTEQTKRSNIKRLIPIIIAAAVIVGLAFSIKQFMAEREKGESQRLERQAEEKAKQEAEAVGKLYGKPYSTVGDTDDVRRYGYDVLFARYGVRVLLKESKIYTDVPELTLEMVNESDEDYTIKLSYCVTNGITLEPSLETKVPAGKTVTDTVVFDYNVMSMFKINKLRMCFLIMNDDYSIYEESEPVKINYDSSQTTNTWEPPDDGLSVYDSSTLKVYTGFFSLTNGDDGGHIIRSELYYNNYSGSDINIYMNSCKLFDKKGSEIDNKHYHVSYSDMLPGNSYVNSLRSIVIWTDDTIKTDDLDELLMIANVSNRGGNDDDETKTITMNIPLRFE